jgi:hypothetical protein
MVARFGTVLGADKYTLAGTTLTFVAPTFNSTEQVAVAFRGDLVFHGALYDQTRTQPTQLGQLLSVQEPFRSQPWRSHPHNSYVSAFWELLYESMERAGTPHQAVEDLPRIARDAGFEVMAMSGFMKMFPPEVGPQIAMATVAAVRERAQALGVATEQE